MALNDRSGSVTICSRGRSGLFADDLGVTVRGLRGARRYAWSDISHFADGIKGADGGGHLWVLDIVLRTGRTRRVPCTAAVTAAPQTLAAVRQVAERHGIPADLTGVPMKNGRPPDAGRRAMTSQSPRRAAPHAAMPARIRQPAEPARHAELAGR